MTSEASADPPEIRPMLRLAAPLAHGRAGLDGDGVRGYRDGGAVGPGGDRRGRLGGMVFFPMAICGTGMLLGMDTLVAQAFGARDDAGRAGARWSRGLAGARADAGRSRCCWR